MGVFLDKALEYYERGLHPIPVRRGTKMAAVKYKELGLSGGVSEDQIRGWFADDNTYDMAILAGPSKVVMIDDDRERYGLDAYDAPLTDFVVKTPNNGKHYYYYQNGHSIGNSQSKLDMHVDARGGNGYTLVPPTKGYEMVHYGVPSEVPDHIAERLLQSQNAHLVEGFEVVTTSASTDAFTLLRNVLRDGFTDGQHNEQLRDLTRLMYRSMKGDEKLQLRLLTTILQELDAKDPTPQAATDNLIPTIKSAIGYEKDRQASAQITVEKEMALSPLEESYAKWIDYQTEYLIQDWLPLEALTYMSAAPQSWKTWTMLDAATSVAMGVPFLDQFEIKHPNEPVIIIQQEDHPGEIVKRLELIMGVKQRGRSYKAWQEDGFWVFETVLSTPIYMYEAAQFRLTDESKLHALENQIKSVGAKLVCVDPFYRLMPPDGYFMEAGQLLGEIKNMRNRTGAGFLFAHHNKKSATAEMGRGGAYGSVLADAAMEVAWMMNKQGSNSVQVQVSGKVLSGFKTYLLNFDIFDGWANGGYNSEAVRYDVGVKLPRSDKMTGTHDEGIVHVIESYGSAKTSVIAEELGENRGTIHNALKRLVKNGVLDHNGGVYSMAEEFELDI